MRKTRKLTPAILRKIVLRERAKLSESSDPIVDGVENPDDVKAEEVDAADLAGSLEKDIDHMKVLQIKEARLRKKLHKIQGIKNKLRRRLLVRL